MGTNTIGTLQKYSVVPAGAPANVGEPSFEDAAPSDLGFGIFQSGRIVFISASQPSAVDDSDLSTPFLTISGAITAMGEVADAAAEKLPRIFFIDGGIYDEALTLPQSGNNIFIALGPVVLGDGAGTNNASSGTPRNVSVTLDNTKVFNERPNYQFITINRVFSGTGDVAYGSSFTISGDFVLSDANSQKGQFYFQGVKLQGNMDDSGLTANDRQDFYIKDSLVSGTFGTGKDIHIMQVHDSEFTGLVNVHEYDQVVRTEITGGMTLNSSNGAPNIDTSILPNGFLHCDLKGTFTAPAVKLFKFDNYSYKTFKDNSATVSAATSIIFSDNRGHRNHETTLTIAAGAITPDLDYGAIIDVSVTENITVNNPVNAFPGALLEIRFTQDGLGPWTYTLDTEFIEGSTAKLTDLATTISKTHSALWERRGSKWVLLAVNNDVTP